MHAQASAPRDGLVVASGYGIKVYVQRGHLVVHDGIGQDRTTRRFHRATSKLKRLVVLGNTGYVTLEAAQWLRDVGAAYVHLDRDGSLLACSAPRATDQPALRRVQALAPTTPTGLETARDLLRLKLEGQAAIAAELPDRALAREAIGQALDDLEEGGSLDSLVLAEAQAANAYWNAWATIEVPFGKRDAEQAPDRWLTLGQRRSQLTNSPRLATNPANAILNYLYALLEAETTLACQTVGLDPGLGIIHTDKKSRASLALDLMEATRPAVDAYVLALLTNRKLRARDFTETPRGVCRLLQPLASELASTTATWASYVAPIAEHVAGALARSAGQAAPPTPLTQVTRRRAVAARRTHTRATRAEAARLPATCRECGQPLADRRRRHCDECLRQRFADASERGRPVAAAVLSQLRNEGRDPAHGGDAARRRGRKNANHQQALSEWNARNGRPDPARFREEILPGLRDVTIGDLVAATGLSEHYCSLIRLGKRVPHARHWDALAECL